MLDPLHRPHRPRPPSSGPRKSRFRKYRLAHAHSPSEHRVALRRGGGALALLTAAVAVWLAVANGAGAPGRHGGVPTTSPFGVPDVSTTAPRSSTTTTVPGPKLWPGSLFTSGDVARWPVAANSQTIVSNLVNDYQKAYGEVGVGQVPIYTVPAGQADVHIAVQSGCNDFLASTGSSLPIPSYAQPLDSSDMPLVIYQPSTGMDWEFWKATRQPDGSYSACWGGALNARRSSGIFPWPYGLAASGISYLATTITEADVASGSIDHALAMQVPACNGFVYPADRGDCGTDPGQPAEGQWFRLPANVHMPLGLSPFGRMVFRALQQYGVVVTDQSGDVSLAAEAPSDWGAQGHPGTDPLTKSFAGLAEYQVVAGIPWYKLQVVQPPHS